MFNSFYSVSTLPCLLLGSGMTQPPSATAWLDNNFQNAGVLQRFHSSSPDKTQKTKKCHVPITSLYDNHSI
jgi:hypothetical protein